MEYIPWHQGLLYIMFLTLLCNRYMFPNKVFSLLIARLSIYHIASLVQERMKGITELFLDLVRFR